MIPVIPHMAYECLNMLSENKNFNWPLTEKKYLVSETKEIVIQINGKKRNTIKIKKDTEEKDILKKIKDLKLVEKYIEGKKIFKTIYVKNRIINIIIK